MQCWVIDLRPARVRNQTISDRLRVQVRGLRGARRLDQCGPVPTCHDLSGSAIVRVLPATGEAGEPAGSPLQPSSRDLQRVLSELLVNHAAHLGVQAERLVDLAEVAAVLSAVRSQSSDTPGGLTRDDLGGALHRFLRHHLDGGGDVHHRVQHRHERSHVHRDTQRGSLNIHRVDVADTILQEALVRVADIPRDLVLLTPRPDPLGGRIVNCGIRGRCEPVIAAAEDLFE